MALFVVQEHHATRLHWDFRLEIDGVLKSWAVPKGPSLDPAQRRLAIRVPDHDLAHADYEGTIPEGTYGAGAVLIWDKGSFEMSRGKDPLDGLAEGELAFTLSGHLLKGEFALVRLRRPGRDDAWLLIKKADEHSRKGWRTPVMLTPARRRALRTRRPACAAQEG